MGWLFGKSASPSRSSGFSSSSTAEEVTHDIDASHLTAIVTGASSGVGAETARVLAMRGAQVVMAVRSVSSGEAVKQSILQETSNARVHVLQLDLSSMASVRKFASEFQALNLPLNILINNAGVMACPFELSTDGIEKQFATNHIGHFLLTELVLDNMKRTAQESGIEGRIVIVSSDAHFLSYKGGIWFDSLNDKSGYYSWLAYGQSKLANILHAKELTRRFQEEGVCIIANALHPGSIMTGLQKHSLLAGKVLPFLVPFMWKTIPQGAATQCLLALHPFVKGVSGNYFVNCNESTPSGNANNPELAKTLWEVSQKIISGN
ncbi:hypothetical protein GOP47_0017534 [Adiantum capillus-veneris]|uniref:Short-chain dehydrogenase TIC 32, chloroplastic-like n=1 Tax=Adiantum capillus-veneris TaxID=13818 RepID=A0A9D4UGR4_ADICA|nr:hypothetical protein GOP47_0017534 [Adiantum capillus-veneris]